MDKRFEDLLLEFAQQEEESKRKDIEKKLWEEFGTVKAVLVMDLSGFSLLTQRYGIVHYLSMVRRMQLASQPVIEQKGGRVVKYEADNCFAMFDDAHAALQAALDLNEVFNRMNVYTEEKFDIRVAIGIDYGDVLLTGGPDFFGAIVNRASKLGEDIAAPGEILITRAAFEHIPQKDRPRAEPLKLSISGIRLDALSIKL